MPLTDQNIRALVHLAVACRPNGAPRWDEAGIFAAVAKVRHLHAADVCLAVIRAADDKAAKTPGVIANTQSPSWQERPARPLPVEPFDRTQTCHVCNQLEHRCRANPFGEHDFESHIDYARRTDVGRRPSAHPTQEAPQ